MSVLRALALPALFGIAVSACAVPAPLPAEGTPPAQSPPAATPGLTPTAAPATAAAGPCVNPPAKPKPPREEGHTHSLPAKPVTIGRVTCKAGQGVWVDAEKRLRACTVDRPVTIEGVTIAADAYTLFHANGRPWQTTIPAAASFKNGGGKDIPCAAEHLVLSEQGVLEHCKLGKAVTLGNIPCKAGESIAFRPGGELWAAVVEKPYSVLGVMFPAGTRLSFHPSGAVAGVYTTETTMLAGYPARYQIDIYESGRLEKFDLGEPLEISGHAFPEFATIWLRENGSLYRAEYVSERGFMIHGEPWEDTRHMEFDCGGRIVGDTVTHYQADHAPRPPKR
jgi:hypothetical protein